MPSNAQPLPAELGAAGSFTRESLTGEPDPLSLQKDQAERVWVRLLQEFWQGQLLRILDWLGADVATLPAVEATKAASWTPKKGLSGLLLSKMPVEDKEKTLKLWGFSHAEVSLLSKENIDAFLRKGIDHEVYEGLHLTGWNADQVAGITPKSLANLVQAMQSATMADDLEKAIPKIMGGLAKKTIFMMTKDQKLAKLQELGFTQHDAAWIVGNSQAVNTILYKGLTADAYYDLVSAGHNHSAIWDMSKPELAKELVKITKAKMAEPQPSGATHLVPGASQGLKDWLAGGKPGMRAVSASMVRNLTAAQRSATLRELGYSGDQITALGKEGGTHAILQQMALEKAGELIPPPKNAFWNQEHKGLLATIGPPLQTGVLGGAGGAMVQFEQMGVRADWALANKEAVTWARKYAGKLVKGINQTTRKIVGDTVGDWIEIPGANYQDLQNALMMQLQFLEDDPRRALLIARTEVTRSYFEGSLKAARAAEAYKTWPDFQPLFRYYKVWQTKNDGVVCTGCEDMHLEEVEGTQTEFMTRLGPAVGPPLHPGCRCWATFRPEAITKEEAEEGYATMKEKAAATKKEKAAAAAAKKEKKPTPQEKIAKIKEEAAALEKQKEAEAKKKQAEAHAKWVKEQEAKKKAEALAAKQKAEAEAKKKAEEAAKKKAALEAKVKKGKWRVGDGFVEETQANRKKFIGKECKFTETTRYGGRPRLNGVNVIEVSPQDWQAIQDKPLPGESPTPKGHLSTGVIMVEPDGRIWVVEPRGHYGGYTYTYPKGSMRDPGLTAQQNAIKEVWEESGLLAEIDGLLGDYTSEHTGNTTRYYIGRRVGGAPWAFQKESQAVYLMDLASVAPNRLHSARDLQVLEALQTNLGIKAVEEAIETIAPSIVRKIALEKGVLPEALPEGIFPDSPEGLRRVRSLGGSTGAELVKDPVTGRLYVMKRGASAGHLRSEVWADTLYRRLGVKVPACQLYETATGPVKLAEYIPNTRSLAEILGSGNLAEKKKIIAQLQEHFVADAYLGNWDVMGTSWDNILIDKAGVAWRVDNGGALLYRAQGALKSDGPAGFDQWMTELWSMRADRSHEWTYKVFGGMDWRVVSKQLEWLGGLPEAELLAGVAEGVGAEVSATLQVRLDAVRGIWQTSNTLLSDKWLVGYVDDFCRVGAELKQAGLLEELPKYLERSSKYRSGTSKGVVSVYDPGGKKWDKLRGPDSVMRWLHDYMDDHGADYEIIQSWMHGQAGNSWGDGSVGLKYWLAQQRDIPTDSYYWGPNGQSYARKLWQGARQAQPERWDKAWQIWHAFNYEFLQNTPFPNNNPEEGYVRLMRTENGAVASMYRFKEKTISHIPRGGAESSSIYRTVNVDGNCLTLQTVPHHRIFGNYFFERAPGSNESAFYGSQENEFVFLPEGLPFYYWGRADMGQMYDRFWTTAIEKKLWSATTK